MPKISFTPFYPEHLKFLNIHPVQTDEYEALLSMAALEALGSCIGVTCWASERVVGIAGTHLLWQDRAEAFCLVSEEMKHYTLQVMHKIGYVLDSLPYKRIEMVVKVNNPHGHKLARHLGFGGTQRIQLPNGKYVQADGLMRSYWPGKDTDVVMYSRIHDT